VNPAHGEKPLERAQLARALVQAARLKGRFRLRSGAVSDTYFDKYRFESNPALLAEVARHLVPLLPPPAEAELLAGLELGGVPLAVMLSQHTGRPAVFVRKRAKQYGTARLAEGCEIEARRLCMIEDVVTSGGQAVLSAQDLRQRGARVDCALCVVDREAGGAEALRKEGVELRALFCASELAE